MTEATMVERTKEPVQFVTANYIALELDVSIRTAQRLIKKQMTHIRVGRQMRVPYHAYGAWKQKKLKNKAAIRTTPEQMEVLRRIVKERHAK